MGTEVVYNGVVMHDVLTRQWDEQVTYEPSNTDALYRKITATFEGLVHIQESLGRQEYPWTMPLGSLRDVSGAYRSIVTRLWQPRCTLTVRLDGDSTELLHVRPASENTATDLGTNPAGAAQAEDVNAGPKPQNVQIVKIVSNQVLKIAFTIEVAQITCQNLGGEDARLPLVISHRWSVAETMNQDFFITRSITGRLRLSRALAGGIQPHRAMIVPMLERGFARESIRFTATENGLEADYEVRDVQKMHAAPWPAVRMEGTHSIMTVDGTTLRGECRVRLWGHPASDPKHLITRLVHVVDARLNLLVDATSTRPTWIVEHCVITQHLGAENCVEMVIRVLFNTRYEKHPELEGTRMILGIDGYRIGMPLQLRAYRGYNYDPTVHPWPDTFGYVPGIGTRSSAALAVLFCYLQNPCSEDHHISTSTAGAVRDTANVTRLQATQVEERYIDELPQDLYVKKDYVTPEAQDAIYTYCRVTSSYTMPGNRVALPIAGDLDEGDDTVSVVSLAPPSCRRILVVDAERVGEWPELPSPESSYSDGKLEGEYLSSTIDTNPPITAADGVHLLYRAKMTLVYSMNRPPSEKEKLACGQMPWMKWDSAKEGGDLAFSPKDVYRGDLLSNDTDTAIA